MISKAVFWRMVRVGDAVYGQAMGCLGTAVVAHACTLAPQPPMLAAAEAAALPTVFLTAAACLTQAASVQPGMRVLIHAATGVPPDSHSSAACIHSGVKLLRKVSCADSNIYFWLACNLERRVGAALHPFCMCRWI